MRYVSPCTALKVSLVPLTLATLVSDATADPVNTAALDLNEVPLRSSVARPVIGAFQLYQTVALASP
jgi:hypothetical protein